MADFNNLYTQMLTKMDERFKEKSLTESMCGHNYTWGDNATITIPTVNHAALVDYDLTAAYGQRTGAIQDISDELNTYTVSRKRTFHAAIDEVVSMDQRFIRKAANVARDTVDFELIPENDKYRMKTWANGAGIVMRGTSADIASDKDANGKDIIRTLLTINAKANNKFVPREGRRFVLSESLAIETQLAERLGYNDQYTTKTIVNGQISHIGNIPIIAVPDEYMPTGCDIIMKWAGSSVDPTKAHKIRFLDKVAGSFATHIEGLFRYDSFVLANKANGIICFGATTANICADPVFTKVAGTSGAADTFTITSSTNGASIKYVISPWKDGFNPKVHEDATAYSSGIEISDTNRNMYVTAYAYKDGLLTSGIAGPIKIADIKAAAT